VALSALGVVAPHIGVAQTTRPTTTRPGPAAEARQDGPQALWLADGNSRDSAGTHHGPAQAAYTADRRGDPKGAFLLDGTKGLVVPNSQTLGAADAFTVCAWVRPARYAAGGDATIVVCKWGHIGQRGDYSLQLRGDGRAEIFVGNNQPDHAQDVLHGTKLVPKGRWTHLAATFHRGELRLYVNGTPDGRKVSRIKQTNRRRYQHDEVSIGSWWGQRGATHAQIFEGAIDEVAIWNRALSPEQVRNVYRDIHALLAVPYLKRLDRADRLVLDDGSVLTGTIQVTGYGINTAFGKLEIPAARVVGFTRDAPADARVKLVLIDAQVLVGTLTEPAVSIRLPDGAVRRVPAGRIRQCAYRLSAGKAIRRLADPAASVLVMRDGTRLLGRLVSSDLKIREGARTVAVAVSAVRFIRFGPTDPGTVGVRMWDNALISGRLGPAALTFEMAGRKPPVRLPIAQIIWLIRPSAAPPAGLLARIERLIAQLGAASFVQRENATRELIRMGKPIRPILEEHRNHPDIEVRERLEHILEQIDGPRPAPPRDPDAARGFLLNPIGVDR
jgi:hypothetical protein